MVSAIPERSMLWVRGSLVLGWVLLTASLFWDPYTLEWTKPDSPMAWLWFGSPSSVQGVRFVETPYAVGAHVFWTFIIPVVPLFLMVFGHNAWRRLCPLSFITQIPRYLGFQRKIPGGNRPPTILNEAWLRRRAWALQFCLLVVALSLRLLFLNSDRMALGIFMIGVMSIALLVGALWGGKTWCHCFCPINVVEMIYTGPSGLIAGASTGDHPPKSMCRTLANGKDVGCCIGCVRTCPDIDQEKSYAMALTHRDVHLVNYGFFGLIVGFYAYFFLYSGDWGYYFSGDWTHVANMIDELRAPGFYLDGHAVAIPKWIAAPATLLFFTMLFWGLGFVAERTYAARLGRQGRPLGAETSRHRGFTVSAFLAINVFYVFSGRSNLILLPGPIVAVVEVMLIALTTSWLAKSLRWKNCRQVAPGSDRT